MDEEKWTDYYGPAIATEVTGRAGNGSAPVPVPPAGDVVTIRLKPDPERIKGIKGKVFRNISNNPDYMLQFIGQFMTDEKGDYLTAKAAAAVLDELEMGEILEAFGALNNALREDAAPKAPKKQYIIQPT